MAAKSSLRTTPLKLFANRESGDWRGSWSSDLMGRIFNSSQNLYRKDLFAHYGCVNAIEFCNDGEWLVSGGDDRRVVLWNVEKAIQGTGKPYIMTGEHSSNIFCLGFDNDNTKIFSAGNDEQVIVHDARTGATIDVFLHEEAVYGLSVDPLNNNVFASACDDGRILIWDMREPSSTDPFCLASYSSAFHAVMYNPVDPKLLACANSREGMSLWDIRNPKSWLIKYVDDNVAQSCMSVRFNSNGTQIFALRRRLPPALYNIDSPSFIHQFNCSGYYNICTMKSCCFAGENDQYVLSGSDDFNLYVWEIPKEGSDKTLVEDTHMVLKGHRSIVNQVRFNSYNFLLASSGVEKIVKLWSPFGLPRSSGGLKKDCVTNDTERKIFTHEEYINLVMHSGQVMTHDYSHQSTKEDPRMMAFFDSLVQREIEGLNTDSNLSGMNSDSWLFNVVEGFSLSEVGSSSNDSSDSESVTVVSDDQTSGVSGDRDGSFISDSDLTNTDSRYQSDELNRLNDWLTNSDSLPSSSSSSTTSSSTSSSTSNADDKKSAKLRKGERAEANRLASIEKVSSWSSFSHKSSSPTLDLISSSSSSENERTTFPPKKLASKWERKKLLRKRRTRQELDDDSDLDDSDGAKKVSLPKRSCLKFHQRNKNGTTASVPASVATTSSAAVDKEQKVENKDPNKCSVVCVAAQNSKFDTLSTDLDEERDDHVEEATTPDSGIASRNFDNEKPSPGTSTYDSSEFDPFRMTNIHGKIRRARIYRSRSSVRNLIHDSD